MQRMEYEADDVEMDREKRVIYVEISKDATAQEIDNLFSEAGKVKKITRCFQDNSRLFDGTMYIEFHESFSVKNAIGTLHNKIFKGKPMNIQAVEEIKKNAQSNTSGSSRVKGGVPKLFFDNLDNTISKYAIKEAFEAIGTVELIELSRDSDGYGRGFVQFAQLESVKCAVEMHANGNIAFNHRNMKVSPSWRLGKYTTKKMR